MPSVPTLFAFVVWLAAVFQLCCTPQFRWYYGFDCELRQNNIMTILSPCCCDTHKEFSENTQLFSLHCCCSNSYVIQICALKFNIYVCQKLMESSCNMMRSCGKTIICVRIRNRLLSRIIMNFVSYMTSDNWKFPACVWVHCVITNCFTRCCFVACNCRQFLL